jgi:bacillolysin
MKRILPLILCILLISSLKAQEVDKLLVGRNGTPKFIKFDPTTTKATTSSSETVLRTYVFTQNKDELKQIASKTDKHGYTHERFQQYFNGVKVEHGKYTVNKHNGNIVSLNGEYILLNEGFRTNPVISEQAALSKALNYIGAQKYMWQNADNEKFAKKTEKSGTYYPKGELVIVQNFLSNEKAIRLQPVLAYKFNIYAQQPLSRNFVYVDAKTGNIVHKNAIIKHANDVNHNHSATNLSKENKKPISILADANGTAATRYSGSRTITADSYSGYYRLRETGTRNVETYNMNMGINYNSATDFTDNDNNWTAAEHNNADKDNAALDAHWGAEMVWDYWNSEHGRNSFDDGGATIESYVHFDLVEYGYSNQDNAFWNGSVMTYGDGTSFEPLTCIDIVAHEIGHAITTYTCDLTYSYESGAMNEGFSDIWAASIEYFADPTKNEWELGEEIGGPIRSLSDPKAYGQPDTYLGTNWYTGSGDNGGVHYNSGVLNHWFYVLSVGESGTNDNGDSYNVSGIGINKAAAIAYRMELVYLSSNAQYADARTYAIQSAEDLYGAGSNEVIQTTNAMYAVGIGSEYGQISYCTSQGNNSSYEWIASVEIGSFTNTSGAAGYTNFTSQTIELESGQSYGISLTPGFASSTYNEYWKIWIDLNADGDFSDAGELVFDAGSMSSSAVTGTLDVPSVADVTTRLRVSMKYNGAQTACETFSYGEVEDYTVSITSGGGDTEAPTAPTNLSSSNVTQTTFTLSWTASTDNVGVAGYEVFMNGASYSSVTGTTANITGLTESTTYSFYVVAEDEAGNVSPQSSTLNVTTLDPVSSCDATVSSYPYGESFESGIGLWQQDGDDDLNWTRNANDTPSSSTGPSSASDGTYYMYIESSSSGVGYPNKTAGLTSPCFDLTAETAATFNFDYHMYGADMGTLELMAKTEGGSWSTIWTQSGDQGNSWYTANVDLSSYTGSVVQLKFFGTTGSSYRSDITVDNVSLTNGGSSGGCTDVVLTINFDNYPEETSWNIKDNAGSTVASGGTYGSQPDGSTLTETICLNDGCYTFTIYDSYGDGICCSYGNGSYSLANGADVIASGGSFSSSDATDFCLTNGLKSFSYVHQNFTNNEFDGFKYKEIRLFPNPVNEVLRIEAGNLSEVDVRITDMKGAERMFVKGSKLMDGLDVTSFEAGMYIIEFIDKDNTYKERFIKK